MTDSTLHAFIVDRVSIGVVVLDRDLNVCVWNDFMQMYSGLSEAEVIGCNLLELFPDIPATWLRKKIESVFILKNFAFTSWQQRPYLFRFRHNRPVTGGIDCMQQDCTFIPIKNSNGEVDYVCISVADVTDTSIYQSRLRVALDSMEQMSIRDGLTSLYNRRFLQTTLTAEFGRVRRHGGELSVLMFDIDHFKPVNDSFGHQAGDEVLKVIAKRVTGLLRSSDVAARYGGEEFTLVLPNTGSDGALQVAERLRMVIDQSPFMIKGRAISVTITVGVSSMRSDMVNYEALLTEADLALYRGKKEGRNVVVVHDHPGPQS